MDSKLTWHSIRDFFKGQWVELIACDWDWNRPYPKRAIVRHHAWDRNELLSLIEGSAIAPGSTMLYVGALESVVEQHACNARTAPLRDRSRRGA